MSGRPPSPAEAQRSNACLAPQRSEGAGKPAVAKIRRWQPYRNSAGTMLGYLDVQLPSGMILNGCKLMVGANSKLWIATPSEKAANKDGSPRLDPKGKQVWAQTVEFVDRPATDRFRDLVLNALRRTHPEALSLTARPVPGLLGIRANCAGVVLKCHNTTNATVEPGATFWLVPQSCTAASCSLKHPRDPTVRAEELHRVAPTPRLPKDLDKSRRNLGRASVLAHGATIYGCATHEVLYSVIRPFWQWGRA
jgi:hypothetical protein